MTCLRCLFKKNPWLWKKQKKKRKRKRKKALTCWLVWEMSTVSLHALTVIICIWVPPSHRARRKKGNQITLNLLQTGRPHSVNAHYHYVLCVCVLLLIRCSVCLARKMSFHIIFEFVCLISLSVLFMTAVL